MSRPINQLNIIEDDCCCLHLVFEHQKMFLFRVVNPLTGGYVHVLAEDEFRAINQAHCYDPEKFPEVRGLQALAMKEPLLIRGWGAKNFNE